MTGSAPILLRALQVSALVAVLVLPSTAEAATCADHSNQAAAQRAADTRDADRDGRYCETLPCPCAGAPPASDAPASGPPDRPAASCVRPDHVVRVGFSGTKYPNIRRHHSAARAAGWPGRLVLNRPGADARRDRLLRDSSSRAGWDRDEYPPAIGRGKGKGLVRGSRPRGWKAHVAFVPSSENRSHGATMGIKLQRYCNGTRFRYVFY